MDNDTKLFIAMFLDFAGLFCAVSIVGEAFSPILDFLGLILLGGNKKQAKKFYLSFAGELVPFVGAFPFWTFYVKSEMNTK